MKTSNKSLNEFIDNLSVPSEPFEPTAKYDPDGDCIEFIIRAEPFYAERIDGLVTVYRSQPNDEIVGSLIKGVSAFCKKLHQRFPGFEITVEAGRVRLDHIFLAKLWTSRHQSKIISLTYRQLIEEAERVEVEAEFART